MQSLSTRRDTPVTVGASADRRVQKDGYSLDEWSRGGLRYAAVSDISPAELEQFSAAFVRSSG